MADTPNVGQVSMDLVLDSKEFKNQLQNSVNQSVKSVTQNTGRLISSTFGKLGRLAAGAFAVGSLINFGRQAIALGSDLEEVQNVADVALGGVSDRVDKFAKSAAKSFGLSELTAKQYIGTMGSMAASFGFAEEEAYNMAQTLTGLVGDVSSFYNLTSDVAYTKLKSVFTGETESLKDLGVVMTQAALDEFALQKGYGKTTKKMTEQEKVALRYAFILDRLKYAQGDFLRTQNSWANQTRILKLQWDSFKGTLGSVLIGVLTPMIRALNILMERLNKAATAFKNFAATVLGVNVNQTTEQVSDGVSQVTQDTEELGSQVASTAKQIKKSLMGFDELNVLADNSSLDGAGDSGSTSTLPGIEAPELVEPSESETQSMVDKWVDKILAMFAPLEQVAKDLFSGNFEAAGAGLSNWIAGLINALAEAIDSVDWTFVGTKIGEFLKGVNWTALLLAIGKLIWEALSAAVEAWSGMFDAAPIETGIITAIALLKFTGLGGIIASKLTSVIVTKLGADSGATIGSAIGGWLAKGFAGIKGLTIFDTSLVMGAGTLAEKFAFLGKMIGGIGMVIGGAWTAIKNFIDMFVNGFSWIKEILMVVGIAIAAVGAVILGAPALVAGIVAAIIAAIATLVIVIKDNWEAVKTFLKSIGEFIVELFKKTWELFKQNAMETVNWVITSFNNFKDAFMRIINGIYNFIAGVFTGNWKRAWQGLGDIVGGIFDGMKARVTTIINGIITIVNKMINGLNSFSFKVPEWADGFAGLKGGANIGFNIPKIPMLANGGYVAANTPQLAVIGDNKREGEVVAPESKLLEAAATANAPVLAAIQQLLSLLANGENGGDITIPIILDGNILDTVIVNSGNRRALRTGGRT